MPVHVRQLNAYGGANLAPDAHDDGMRSSFSSQSPGWMAASFGGARMNMQDVTVHFRDFAACRGVVIDQLSALESIDLMAAFYREVRADDCDLDVDGDMLLFQWGVYDWGESKFFEYDITRQLIPGPASDDEEPHGFIGQLSLTLKFPPSAALEEIAAGNRWCHHPSELADFLAFVRRCEATAAVKARVPIATSLTYGNVE